MINIHLPVPDLDPEELIFELVVKINVNVLPNFYDKQYMWLRKLTIISPLIFNMDFLNAIPHIEDLIILSKNLKEISRLGGLTYLNLLNLDNCDIKCVNDYPSYLKLVELYAKDQEDTDNHHFYNSKLLIGKNPFNFIPHISKYYPLPSLKDLASAQITFKDLHDDSINAICTSVKLNQCHSCKQIRFLNDCWMEKTLGFIMMYVKCKICYKCLVQEHLRNINKKNKPFGDHFNELLNDLNKIINFT